jgi:hypothetical protein
MPEAFYVPIDPSDLGKVADMLRKADVFTPTFHAPEIDIYDPTVYLQQKHRFNTETVLRLDRNVFTRILALARGMSPTNAHRLAAAVIAFAQCAQIEIEPNLALYEGAHHDGNATAASELALFRQADHAHPGYWTEVALGRDDCLDELPEVAHRLRPEARTNFSMPLRRWRRNYILCLKLAELELQAGNASERLRTFVRWSYEEFLLGGPAIALAAHYLAPNAPRKRLMKGLRSADRERALEGIRNAAWDLSIVSQWLLDVEQQEQSYRLVLLTSFDTGLHRVARAVADTSSSGDVPGNPLRRALSHLWGAEAGSRLASEIEGCYGDLNSPHRRINAGTNSNTIEEFIAQGEARIREWKPSGTEGSRIVVDN